MRQSGGRILGMIKELLKFFLSLVATLLGPVVLILLGLATLVLAAYLSWNWLFSVGIFFIALGVIWGGKVYFSAD